jgi:hypothetical protein
LPFIVPFIPLIAAGITAGTSIGLTLSNEPGGSSSSSQQQQDPAQMVQNAVQQETQSRQSKAGQAAQLLPDLQYNTGGGLNQAGLAADSATFSGNGDIANSQTLQDLISKFLGTGSGSSSFGGSTSYGSSSGGLT